MSETPKDLTRGDIMKKPTMNAPSAPDGERDFLRRPWAARRTAMKKGMRGMFVMGINYNRGSGGKERI